MLTQEYIVLIDQLPEIVLHAYVDLGEEIVL
jgi:hypothetical protein